MGGIPSPFGEVAGGAGVRRKEGDPVETEATGFIFPQQQMQQTLV